MYRVIISFILIFISTSVIVAQEVGDKQKVDADTYKLYLSKDWSRLIDEGETALKDGIDFYYLRMRLGMAYYYTGNYRKAEKHFKKAVDIGYRNDIVDEYIYYSLIFSGRHDDARFWGENMNLAMQRKLGLDKKSFFNTVGFSNTYSFNPDSYEETFDDLSSKDGWRNISKSYNLFTVNAGNQLGKGVKLNYQYSRLDKDNFYYYNDDTYDIMDKSRKVIQNQFYIALSVRHSLGFEIFGGAHFVNISTKNKGYTELTNGQGFGNSVAYSYSTSSSDNLLFLGVLKELGNISMGITGYFSNFNNNKQSQYDAVVNYYPLGNLNLYTSSIISFYSDNGTFEDRSGTVFNQKLGLKVSKHLWFEAFTAIGDMNNFVVNRGTGIFNGTEIVKNYSGASFIVPLVKSGAKLFFNYTYYKNKSHLNNIVSGKRENPINFNAHSITGGVQWNF